MLKNYYIAYIDILGMKDIIISYPDNVFNDFCDKISRLVKDIISSNHSNEKFGISHIDFHMFSDNMIFLCEDFDTLADFIALLQIRIIVQLGLLVKGVINYGSVYYEEGRFILGKGLLFAYLLDKDYHRPALKIEKTLAVKYKTGLQLASDEFIIDYLYHTSHYDFYDFMDYVLPIHKKN